MRHGGRNFRELDHKLLFTGSTIEIFLENNCTLYYDTQIIPPNIVLLWSSSTPNVQVVHQTDFRKVRQAKQIKSTQVH